MLWPVTSLKRPRCPKRLRSKIGSNRSPRYLGASDTFSLLSPWILLYLHRERGRKICRRSFRSPVFISILYCGGGGEGNRFGRSYGLSGSYSLPYSLCARGNRKMEETNLEGLETIPRLNLLGDESRSLLQEEKLRVEAEVYTSWRRWERMIIKLDTVFSRLIPFELCAVKIN